MLNTCADIYSAQCLSWQSVRLGIKGLLIVRDSQPAESLCYVLEQDILSPAYEKSKHG